MKPSVCRQPSTEVPGKTKHASLKSTRLWTGSQCNWRDVVPSSSSGEKPSGRRHSGRTALCWWGSEAGRTAVNYNSPGDDLIWTPGLVFWLLHVSLIWALGGVGAGPQS